MSTLPTTAGPDGATFVRHADTLPRVVPVEDGEVRHLRHFFGDPGQLQPGPQGFMVGLPPHAVGRAHFHEVDQFQVFFPARGATYQRHPVDRVMVHYADGYTTYGPFAAGEAPLEFFTLRAQPTLGTWYMPESRDRLVRRGRRTRHVDVPDAAPVTAGTAEVTRLLADDDGMAVDRVQLGPGASCRAPGGGPSGAYLCVLEGDLVHGATLGPRTLGWWSPGAPELELRAGPQGCDLVVLTFPRSSAASDRGDRRLHGGPTAR